jgi:hypothetical protein
VIAVGYLDALRQNQFRPHPAERAERDEPPPSGPPSGGDTLAPEDRCAAPGCRAPIDRFGPDGVGRCVRHAHAPPNGAGTKARGGSPCEESEESEERGARVAPPAPSAAIVQGRACEESEESEERGAPAGACPRCERLDAAARQVLEQLRAHPALPPALRVLSPERLGILVKWSIILFTNPRPQWPPPRPTDAKRRHRRPLDAIVEDLGGHASGAEPPPALEEWDDAGD